MRGVRKVGCFSSSEGLELGWSGKEKARSLGYSGGQEVAASAVPWLRHGAVGDSAGAGWLTDWWFWWPRGVMGLQLWAVRGPYGGRYEAARERACEWGSNTWKRGSLAGHIEGCSML